MVGPCPWERIIIPISRWWKDCTDAQIDYWLGSLHVQVLALIYIMVQYIKFMASSGFRKDLLGSRADQCTAIHISAL